MARLDELRDEFDERNAPLHLLLGLVSLARRLDAALPPADAAPPAAAAPPEDPPMLLILGLISLRRTLLRELEPVRAAHDGVRPPRPAEANPRRSDEPALRGLLR